MSCADFWRQELAARLQGATFIAPGQVDGATRCNREGCGELVRRDTQCCLRGHHQSGGADVLGRAAPEFQALDCVVRTLPSPIRALASMRALMQGDVGENWPARMEQALAALAGEPDLDSDPRIQAARAFVTDWRRARGEEPRPGRDALRRWRNLPPSNLAEVQAENRAEARWEKQRRERPDSPAIVEELPEEGCFRVGRYQVDLKARTCTCRRGGPQDERPRCVHLLAAKHHSFSGDPADYEHATALHYLEDYLHLDKPPADAAATLTDGDLHWLGRHTFSARVCREHPEAVRAGAVRLALVLEALKADPEQNSVRSLGLYVLTTWLRQIGESDAADQAAAERLALDRQTRQRYVQAATRVAVTGTFRRKDEPEWLENDDWREGRWSISLDRNYHCEGHYGPEQTVHLGGINVSVDDHLGGMIENQAHATVAGAGDLDATITGLIQKVEQMCPHEHVAELGGEERRQAVGRQLFPMEHVWRCRDCGRVTIVDTSD